jgi:hypothetical protein
MWVFLWSLSAYIEAEGLLQSVAGHWPMFFFLHGAAAQRGLWPPHSRGFFLRSHTRRATVGKTPLDECSVRRRYLYLTTHNTHNRQTSRPRRDSNPQSQQLSGRRPRGPWDRQWPMLLYINIKISFSRSRSQRLCAVTYVQSVADRRLQLQFWNPVEELPMRDLWVFFPEWADELR